MIRAYARNVVIAVIAIVGMWQAARTLTAQDRYDSAVTIRNSQKGVSQKAPRIESFLQLIQGPSQSIDALLEIEASNHPGNAAMLLDVFPYIRSHVVLTRVAKMLEDATGVAQAQRSDAWYRAISVSYTHLTLPTICSV